VTAVRPAGVRERIREVALAERAVVESWTDRRLRVRLTTLIDLCARLHYDDHPVAAVLRCYARVDELLADPAQRRTGTDFEVRSLACVTELHPLVGPLVAGPVEEVPLAAQDEVREPLTAVPPRTILGEDGPDSAFDLVCWNEANAVAEDVQRPYRAARHIATEGFHDPTDAFGLVAPLTELAERYEDVPGSRTATGAEIVRVLDEFRARAPWPITD